MPTDKSYTVSVKIEVRETQGYSASRVAFTELERIIAVDESQENAVNDAVMTAQSEVDRQFLALRRVERRERLEAEREAE